MYSEPRKFVLYSENLTVVHVYRPIRLQNKLSYVSRKKNIICCDVWNFRIIYRLTELPNSQEVHANKI